MTSSVTLGLLVGFFIFCLFLLTFLCSLKLDKNKNGDIDLFFRPLTTSFRGWGVLPSFTEFFSGVSLNNRMLPSFIDPFSLPALKGTGT